MKRIVVLGAGLGGLPMAFEMRDLLKAGEELTVVAKEPTFHFTPSNPWVAVNWRSRPDIEVPLAGVLARKGIALETVGAKRLHPERSEVELSDGRMMDVEKVAAKREKMPAE